MKQINISLVNKADKNDLNFNKQYVPKKHILKKCR